MGKKRLTKNQEGATTVELALVLPLLLLVLFGIIEFSLILYNKAMLTNACREGTRAAVLFSWTSDDDIEDRISSIDINNAVDNYCKQHLIAFGDSGYNINPPRTPITYPCEGNQGEFITVSVDYVYDFLFLPFAQIPLNVSSVMRCE